MICKDFHPFSGLSFHVFMVCLDVQKLLSLVRFHLFIFVFLELLLGGGSNKLLL